MAFEVECLNYENLNEDAESECRLDEKSAYVHYMTTEGAREGTDYLDLRRIFDAECSSCVFSATFLFGRNLMDSVRAKMKWQHCQLEL